MAFGAGNMPVGQAPFGLGVYTMPPPPPAPARDAAYIDPATRDYALRADGELARMPTTRQQVMLVLTQLVGSSTVDPSGTALPDRMDERFVASASTEVRSRLQPLIVGRALTLEGVDIETGDYGRALVIVRYRDLATGRSETVRL